MTAVLLRTVNLDSWPPGLYRDEAFNGLDALELLDGDLAVFFTANNGREPLYIYLTAVSVGLFGRSVVAVRLTAAVVGSLMTLLLYKLGRTWFGWRVGLLAAWLWAITLWPMHLSRVGLRPILLPAVLVLTFWLGTEAYRRQRRGWWLAAGLAYGLGYYTYLAIRFTPLLLLAVAAFLLWRGQRERIVAGAGWFVLGTAVALLPLALFYAQSPDLLLGRTGQVSIFNPAINNGDFWARCCGRWGGRWDCLSGRATRFCATIRQDGRCSIGSWQFLFCSGWFTVCDSGASPRRQPSCCGRLLCLASLFWRKMPPTFCGR